MRHILIAFVVLFGAYLLFAPVDIEPVAWQPQPAPPSDSGLFAGNDLLKPIERIAPSALDPRRWLSMLPAGIERH